MKRNWIVISHNRHRDDKYVVLINATLKEAEAKEREIADKEGWLEYTEVAKYGYGDYGLSEEYYVCLRELESDEVVIAK